MYLEAKIVHCFSASIEDVFEAWLNPEMIGKWMFGPAIRDEQVVSIEIDPKVGGAFSFLVNRQNTVIDHVGTYLVIDRPKRLEFNWGVKGMSDNSRVIVDIIPKDNGCELTLIHELHPDWIEYLERAKEGWSQMMDVLDKTLTNNKLA